MNSAESLDHSPFKLCVDFSDVPIVVIRVLNLLQIRDRYPARVRQEVGNHIDAPLVENYIRVRRCWTVRKLADDLCPDLVRIPRGYGIFQRRGDKDVHRQFKDFFRVHRFGAVKTRDRSGSEGMLSNCININSITVEDGAAHVGSSDNGEPKNL